MKQRRHERASHSGLLGSSDADSEGDSGESVLCALGIPKKIDLVKFGLAMTEDNDNTQHTSPATVKFLKTGQGHIRTLEVKNV